MAINFTYTAQELYSKTNNGLDILHKYIPECVDLENTNNKFSSALIREEKTPSCTLYSTDNYWIIKDHGGENYNPVNIVMKITGLEFLEALKHLYSEFNISETSYISATKKDFKENTKNLSASHFEIEIKKKPENLDYFGPFVTLQNAKDYNIVELDSYVRVTKKTNEKSSKIITVTATASYPIFAYSNNLKKWAKTYCPGEFKHKNAKGQIQNYKHGYLGTKDDSYVHGLELILKHSNEKEVLKLHKELSYTKGKEARKGLLEQLKEHQVENIIICTGGSDGINVASLDHSYYPIWFNSESEQISFALYSRLRKLCVNFYNLPDTDIAGVKYANEVANKYWNLKTIQLPQGKMGKNGKDFRDWMAYYKKADKEDLKDQFDKLLRLALKCNFTEKNEQGRPRIHLAYFHYFLNTNNYFSYKEDFGYDEKSNEDKSFVVKLNNHVVSVPESAEIRNFTIDYVKDKGVGLDIVNLIKRAKVFNVNELKTLNRTSLDFTNNTAKTQLFYFNNGVVNVTAEKVSFSSVNGLSKYVWKHKVNQKNFRVTNKFFNHHVDGSGNNRVTISKDNCEFRNYLINSSRVFWRKELEEPFSTLKEAKVYQAQNKFTLNDANLTSEEHLIQERHFLNKCFSIGYLMHRFKREDFAKFVYVMDDAVKESVDEANGGTGKSLLVRALEEVLSIYYIDGKKANLDKDSHLFGGLKLEDDLITLEDGIKNMGFETFYNKVTGKIDVNPKQKQGFNVPFSQSPKFVGTFNYGINKSNGSNLRRLFYVSFSDYYHAKTDNFKEERKVSDDFGHSFFQDWDNIEYNNFFNFLMQCCQFYLANIKNEMTAPMDNISVNNLKSQIGDNTMEWAENYFMEDARFNKGICRREMYEDYKLYVGPKSTKGVNNFKTSLEKYCKINNYVFNPFEMLNRQGRIKENYYPPGSQKRSTREVFYIQKNTEDGEKEEAC